MTNFLKMCIHGVITGLGIVAGVTFADRVLQGHLWQELLSVATFVLVIEVVILLFFPTLRRSTP